MISWSASDKHGFWHVTTCKLFFRKMNQYLLHGRLVIRVGQNQHIYIYLLRKSSVNDKQKIMTVLGIITKVRSRITLHCPRHVQSITRAQIIDGSEQYILIGFFFFKKAMHFFYTNKCLVLYIMFVLDEPDYETINEHLI